MGSQGRILEDLGMHWDPIAVPRNLLGDRGDGWDHGTGLTMGPMGPWDRWDHGTDACVRASCQCRWCVRSVSVDGACVRPVRTPVGDSSGYVESFPSSIVLKISFRFFFCHPKLNLRRHQEVQSCATF